MLTEAHVFVWSTALELFEKLTKFSYNFLEPIILEWNLLLLRFFLASIALWLMTGIFTSLCKFNKTLFTSLTDLLTPLVAPWNDTRSSYLKVNICNTIAKCDINCPITCVFFSDGTLFTPTWNIICLDCFYKLMASHKPSFCCQGFLLFPNLDYILQYFLAR